jgi:hypothetical protein
VLPVTKSCLGSYNHSVKSAENLSQAVVYARLAGATRLRLTAFVPFSVSMEQYAKLFTG